ncbi:tape measure protein [Corynebacterium glyciniphilum]|uniref:tape measure protein n=1 Tax=Corynebacterium glyciniphilum TaxID=1404244 RepID=UPI002653A213|nr:tape measure protein [Corynebacterium glyciniphilum]MDN6706373.1 tape measure protein [Corynebacterium glyciniphilum]
MAVELAHAYVSIIPETSKIAPGVEKALGGTTKPAEKTGRSLGEKLSSGIGKTLKVGAIGAGATAGVALGRNLMGGFQSAVSDSQTEAALEGLYGSASDAADMMERIGNVSRGSSLNTDAYNEAATSLAYLGVKGQESEDILTNVGKAIVAAGGESGQLDQATAALTRMVNEGRVGADTLNQLSGSGVPIFDALANKMGVANDELRGMVSEGLVDLDDVLGTLSEGSGDLFQQMLDGADKVESTFGPTWSRFKDNANSAMGEVVSSLTESLTPALSGAADSLGDFGSQIAPVAGEFVGELSASLLDFTKSIAPDVQDWAGVIGDGLQGIADGAKSAAPVVKKLGDVAGKVPWQAYAGGLAAVVAQHTGLTGKLDSGRKSLVSWGKGIKDSHGALKQQNADIGLVASGMQILGQRVPVIGNMGNAFQSSSTKLRLTGMEMREAGVQSKGLSGAMKVAGGSAASFGGYMKGAASGGLSLFKDGVVGIARFIGPQGAWAAAIGGATWLVGNLMQKHKEAAEAEREHKERQRELKDSLRETNGQIDEQIEKMQLKRLEEVLSSDADDDVDALELAATANINQRVVAGAITGDEDAKDKLDEQVQRKLSNWAGSSEEVEQFGRTSYGLNLDDALSYASGDTAKADEVLAGLGKNDREDLLAWLRTMKGSFDDATLAAGELRVGVGEVFGESTEAMASATVEITQEFRDGMTDATTAAEILGDKVRSIDDDGNISVKMSEAEYADVSAKLDEIGVKSDYEDGYIHIELPDGPAILSVLEQIDGEVNYLPNGRIDIDSNTDEVNEQLRELGVLSFDEMTSTFTMNDNVGETLEDLVDLGALAYNDMTGELYINDNVGQVRQGLSTLGVETTNLPEGKVHLLENTQAVRDKLTNLEIKYTTLPDGRIAITDTTAENIANLEAAGFKTTTLPGGFIAIDDTSQSNLDHLASLGVTTRELPDGTVVITDNADDVADHVGNALEDGKLDSSSDHQVNVTIDIVESVKRIFGGGSDDGKADGGRIPKSAVGRRIGSIGGYRLPTTGPGTSETDGILGVGADGAPTSWVDAGEWVINAESSEKYDPLLAAVNADDEEAIAALSGHALGGKLGGGAAAALGGADLQVGLDIPDGEQFDMLRDRFTGLATDMQTASSSQIAPALSGVSSSVASTAADFTNAVGSQIAPAMSRMGQSVVSAKTSLVDPAFAGVRSGLNLLAGQFGTSTSASESEWSGMGSTVKSVQTGTVDPAFAAIRGGLDTVESAFSTGTAGMNSSFRTIEPGTADPARYAIGQVFNGGIVNMWNSASELLGTSRMNPAPMAFASGGYVRGPGSTTSDSIPALLSDREYVLDAKTTSRIGVDNLRALQAGDYNIAPGVLKSRAEQRALLRDKTFNTVASRYQTGGIVKGSDAWKALLRGYNWARSRDGRPYVWGGSAHGSDGTDCSGYMSGIADVILGGNGARQWATMTFPDTQAGAWAPGLASGFSVGISDVHTAGTLGGVEGIPAVNVESGGNNGGVSFGGPNAVGANDGQFPRKEHLIYTGDGKFVGGSGSGASMGQIIGEMVGKAQEKMKAGAAAYAAANPGLINTWPSAVADSLGGAAREKIDKLTEELMAFTGGNAESYRGMIKAAYRRQGYQWTQEKEDAWVRQIVTESSGDPRADQQIQDINSGGNEAQGLLQIARGTWPGARDPELPDDPYDPWANINAAIRYGEDKYGDGLLNVIGHGHGYDRGGIAADVGMLAKYTNKPERVLSPQQTAAFDRLVHILDRDGVDAWSGHAQQMSESLSVIAKEVSTAYRGGDWGYGELSRYIGEDRARQAVNEAGRLGEVAREITTAFRDDDWASSATSQLLGGNAGFGNAVIAAAGAAGQASRGDLSGAMDSSAVALQEAADGIRKTVGIFNAGVREWAAGDENRGRLGNPKQWAIHFGGMAAQEFASDALGLLGLEDLANVRFSESFVNLVNAASDTMNDVWGTHLGHITQDSAQPLSLLDDEGRLPKPQESVAPAPAEPAATPEPDDEVTLAAVSPEAADDLATDGEDQDVVPDDFMANPAAGVAAINAAQDEEIDPVLDDGADVTVAGITPNAVADLNAQSDLMAEPMADVADLSTTAVSEPSGQDVPITLTGDAFSADQVEEMLGEVNTRVDNTNIRVSRLEKKQLAKVTAGAAAGFL